MRSLRSRHGRTRHVRPGITLHRLRRLGPIDRGLCRAITGAVRSLLAQGYSPM